MITRIKNARLLHLDQALDNAKGSTIDGVRDLNVTRVDERKTSDGGNSPWSVQTLHVQSDGIKAYVKVWDFPDLTFLKGAPITIEGTVNGKNKVCGVMVDEYKGDRQIKVTRFGLIDFMESKDSPDKQWHNVAAHDGSALEEVEGRGDRGGRGGDREERRGDHREQREETGRGQQTRGQRYQEPKRQTKAPIHGATIGMAINQANVILVRRHGDEEEYFGSPAYSEDLFNIASDIVRVAMYMERGNLAIPTKTRDQEQERDQREEREAESSQTQQRDPRGGQHASREREERPDGEHANEEPVAGGGSSWQDDVDDSDIPF